MEVGGAAAAAADAMQAPDQQPDQQVQQVVKEAPERDPSEAAAAVGAGEQLEFTIVFGKASSSVKRAADSTVGELKADAEARTGVPSSSQKLLVGGKALKDDAATLKQVGIKKGSKVLLIGTAPASVVSGPPPGAEEGKEAWDAEAAPTEPICQQKQHLKVLDKGVPEDAMPSIKGKQLPMPPEINAIPGLMNSQGVKVRLTFKEDMQQLWIASATTTQKVPYGTITKIESFPIDGKEEYSILSLHLGSGASSKYWLYFFPSQYVAGIKIRILGLESLI